MEKKITNDFLYQKINKQKKSKFPVLYSSPKTIYNKRKIQKSESLTNRNYGNLTYRNNLFYNSINETFYKRNYDKYLDKINKQKSFFNNNIISKKDLDILLYKLKKNYNLITTITRKRNSEIDTLNRTLQTEQDKLKKIIDFQEIELPEEKISLKKIGDTKMSKEELEKYLKDLLDEKRELDNKIYISNQYTKTVQYMLDEEKRKILITQNEINEIQEKINNFKRYHDLISDNLNKTKLKDKNYNELNKKIQKDINLANQIINNNNDKNDYLENKIILKEDKNDNLKHKIISLKQSNKEEFKIYKDDIINKIQKSREDEEEKNRKDKKYIDIIYCLYILQKFFLQQQNFDFQKIVSSKEYKTIISGNYDIFFNNKLDKENENSDNFLELKKIFNGINIEKENIFDFISKLSSKIIFNKNCLDNLHQKELSLIEKKDKYSEKIRKIINEDYLTFEEFAKNSLIVKSFLDKNEKYIEKIKNTSKENTLIEINRNLNLNEIDKKNNKYGNKKINNFTKNEKLYKEIKKEQIIINSNQLYKKSNELIISHNNFLDKISDILNNIVISIQNNNNEKNINEDNNNNLNNQFTDFEKSFINEYEKIIELQQLIQIKSEDNSFNFIKYIKELIEYNKKIIKEKLNEQELNNNLLFLFYKDKEKKEINEILYTQFISNITHQNNIFNFFNNISNKSIDTIKSIIDVINNNENLLDNYINNNNFPSSMKSSLLKKNNQKIILNNNFDSSNPLLNMTNLQTGITNSNIRKMKNRKSQIFVTKREKSDGSNSAWVEDKETSFETESVKKEEKIFKRKINYIEKNIMNNLYKPTFEKSDYLRKLNTNMKNIKNMTLNYSKFNFIIKQKKNEIDLMGNQMLLYNNPNIHPDELSNPIYNNINNIMINRRIHNPNNKRFRSTYANRKYKYKI